MGKLKYNELLMEEKLFIKTTKLSAEALYQDDKIVIQKGSQAKLDTSASFPRTQKESRDNLIDSGVLKENNGCLVFTKNYLCNSPSQASNLITGTSSNGMILWKDKNGKTLHSLLRQVD